MSLPNRLRSARLTNATLGSSIDDEVGNLERALCDILGIPIDTDVAAALFAVTAAGLQTLTLQNASANPVNAGELQRNNTRLLWHNSERAVELQPAGECKLFHTTSTPTGYLLMDGAAYSRTTYARLFAAIGISGGPGDGSTTFNVPDWRGLVPVGQNPSDPDFDVIGKTGGAKQVSLAHTHTLSNHTHAQQGTFTSTNATPIDGLVAGGGLPAAVNHTHNMTIGGLTGGPSVADTGASTLAVGSVVQPYGVAAWYIST